MPEYGRPFDHGNLYIHFSVVFPEKLESEQVEALQTILGGERLQNGDAPMDVDGPEEVNPSLVMANIWLVVWV